MPPLIEWFKLILLTFLAVLAFQTFKTTLDWISHEKLLDREMVYKIEELKLKK